MFYTDVVSSGSLLTKTHEAALEPSPPALWVPWQRRGYASRAYSEVGWVAGLDGGVVVEHKSPSQAPRNPKDSRCDRAQIHR